MAVMVSYLIWAKLHPSQLFVVLSAHSPNVAACCSEDRNNKHHQCESALMALMNTEISNAKENGDLKLPSGMCFEQVTFALWSTAWGAMALVTSKGNSPKLNPMLLERETFTNTRLLLDGFKWLPLSNEWDYSDSIRRITEEIFQPEIDLLKQKQTPFIFI